MRYICLGYWTTSRWQALPPAQRDQIRQACAAYEAHLQRCRHLLAAEALQGAEDVVAVCRQDGQVTVMEGPCPAASQIGELLILDARDLNHAIQLLSLHPALALGGFEIRPQANEPPAGFTLSAQGESI